MVASNVKVKIAFNDPNLEPEEREEQAQQLMAELRSMDEVHAVDRIVDPNPPQNSKAFAGFLTGLLMAEVSMENTKKLLYFLGDRLGNKPIELSVEANGKSLSIKANSREELQAAIQAAQEFIAS